MRSNQAKADPDGVDGPATTVFRKHGSTMSHVSNKMLSKPTRSTVSSPSGGAPKATQRLTWHVNWPLLLGTLAGVVVIAPLGHFWHSYQLNRHELSF